MVILIHETWIVSGFFFFLHLERFFIHSSFAFEDDFIKNILSPVRYAIAAVFPSRALSICHSKRVPIGSTSAICDRACSDDFSLQSTTHYSKCNTEGNQLCAIFTPLEHEHSSLDFNLSIKTSFTLWCY